MRYDEIIIFSSLFSTDTDLDPRPPNGRSRIFGGARPLILLDAVEFVVGSPSRPGSFELLLLHTRSA
jgi:hypothetical protein